LLNRKDKEAVLDPYFQVLKLLEDYDEDYVELKSKCTWHCWMIQVKGGKFFCGINTTRTIISSESVHQL
jgi:hypothetical protein